MEQHTFNPRVLKNLISKLDRYIVKGRFELPEWDSYTGVHTSPAHIELDGNGVEKMHLGDRWCAQWDTTRYFETRFIVPHEFEGEKIYLTIDFGGEAIVRINGKIVGAVSSNEEGGWVHRTEILFDKPLSAGEELFIQIENAVNAAGYFNFSYPGVKPITYTMKSAYFSVINEDAEAVYYDLNCAFDVYEACEDEYVAKRIYNVVDTAAHMLDYDMGNERFWESIPKTRKYLWEQLEKIAYATPGEVILCGHSHLDVAWLWTVKEIHRKCARTFSNNIALMKKYPDFKFTQSQAAVYSFIKDCYPEIFEEVKKYVKNGQWEITGNAWVEADTNIASGESLIRQILYGRRFFTEEFGVSSDIYWLPDCFGFSPALPQIIKKSGMKYFLTSKLQNNDTNEFPMSVYKWRSHSGDEVLAYMQKVGYESDADAAYIVRTRKSNRQNELTEASMGMYGYGDGGGGCTFEMVEKLRRYNKISGLPKNSMGHAKDFFAEVEKCADALPVWDGEMYYENHRGTFTSQAFVKKNNRRGEYMLRNAEMLTLADGTYNRDELDKMWKLLLTNQFHDILPGTSIREVFENTREEYALLNEKGEKIISEALARLSKNAATGENSIVVWNFLPYEITANVTSEIPFENACITDIDGNIMPSCVTDGTVEFVAKNIPPMGYKVFKAQNKKSSVGSVKAGIDFLENDYIRAEFNENGQLISLVNKALGENILGGVGNRLSISHDKPIHESAWNLENDYKMKTVYLDTAQSVELVHVSPVKAVIRVKYGFNESVISQDITLTAEGKTLVFDTKVDWHEREKVLKAEFPTAVRSRYATYEVAHGAVERPTYANNSYERAMFEVCAHKWADLSQGDRGLSIINDCKYGYDILANVMRITLMRAPVLPDPTADIGISEFKYGVYAHENGWNLSECVKEAFAMNVPPKAVFEADGNGEKSEFSYITLSDDRVMLDAVKAAEDGNGIIVRMYETSAHSGKVKLTLACDGFTVRECNLVEENGEAVPTDGNSFEFSISPYEVKTFRIMK